MSEQDIKNKNLVLIDYLRSIIDVKDNWIWNKLANIIIAVK